MSIMKCKRRLWPTESCQKQRVSTKSIIDRLSNLPDEVVHHILSFLPFRDLTRVGTVSKRCNELYLSIPFLNFDAILFPSCNQMRGELLNSLERFFSHRGKSKIQCFGIRWLFLDRNITGEFIDEHYQVITWIHNAIRCKVEELDLDFTGRGTTILALSSCIYVCPSLRSLSVNLRGNILPEPSSSFSCNLQYLTLRNVMIEDIRFCKWMSHSCKSLKELQLIIVKGLHNITIESSSLESFKLVSGIDEDLFHLNITGEKLEDIHIAWGNVLSPSRKSLNISAPNLKNLKWEGHLISTLNLGKFLRLEKAEILLCPMENEFDSVLEILCSICKAKVVILNELTTKVRIHTILLTNFLLAKMRYSAI